MQVCLGYVLRCLLGTGYRGVHHHSNSIRSTHSTAPPCNSPLHITLYLQYIPSDTQYHARSKQDIKIALVPDYAFVAVCSNSRAWHLEVSSTCVCWRFFSYFIDLCQWDSEVSIKNLNFKDTRQKFRTRFLWAT